MDFIQVTSRVVQPNFFPRCEKCQDDIPIPRGGGAVQLSCRYAGADEKGGGRGERTLRLLVGIKLEIAEMVVSSFGLIV